MLGNLQLIYDSRNYTVINVDDDIICFSYKKLIGAYNTVNQKLVKFNKNITTETNKKHFAYFLKYLQKKSWQVKLNVILSYKINLLFGGNKKNE